MTLLCFFKEGLLFFPEMTCLSPLQLPAPPSLSAEDLATYSTENKEEPETVPDGSPSPSHHQTPTRLAYALLLCSSFFKSVCPAPSKASPSSWDWEPIPDTFSGNSFFIHSSALLSPSLPNHFHQLQTNVIDLHFSDD